jgi:RNA polymerase sigma factor (sigma-70 family)
MLQQHHWNRPYIAAVDAARREGLAASRGRTASGSLDRIVVAAAAGEQAAWNALVARFTRRIRSAARSHRMSAHDAEDIAQTTWLRLFEHIDSIRDPMGVGAWLETTAKRESLDTARRRDRVRLSEDDDLVDERADETDITDQLEATQRATAVAQAIERLPESQRRLMALLASEEQPSYAEIARALSIPVGSIGPTRQRILGRMQQDSQLAQALGR